jgi:hypothetical protein
MALVAVDVERKKMATEKETGAKLRKSPKMLLLKRAKKSLQVKPNMNVESESQEKNNQSQNRSLRKKLVLLLLTMKLKKPLNLKVFLRKLKFVVRIKLMLRISKNLTLFTQNKLLLFKRIFHLVRLMLWEEVQVLNFLVSRVLRMRMMASYLAVEEVAAEVVELIELALKDHRLNVVAAKAVNLLSTTMTSQLFE